MELFPPGKLATFTNQALIISIKYNLLVFILYASECNASHSFFRMKREVASTIVEKGVNERIRLTQIYEKKKDELFRQHQEVQNHVEEERARVSAL